MSEIPLIDIHQATVWRGSTCVFRDFSLTIGRNERVAVLGPNGSGKTTLLKTITQEVRPVYSESSWIKILGQQRWDVWDLRQHFGLVSEDLQGNFLPGASVVDVVVSGFFATIGVHSHQVAQISDGQRERVHTVMQLMGIAALGDRVYQSLSTGQKRRCLLARALVHQPETLIFDEPMSGLDITAGFDLMERVRALAQNGTGLVWVTHHLNDIPPEIDRVVVLRNGRIVADGPKKVVLTEALLNEVYETDLRIAEIEGYFFAYPNIHES